MASDVKPFRKEIRSLRLTREMILAVHPSPGEDDPTAIPLLTDEEVAASLESTLASLDADSDLWVFGYGSLMWKPEMDFAESRIARVSGWHRRFCLWQWRYRGTRAKPGLMLALDRGGSCQGIAFRVAPPDVRAKIAGIWRREMIGKGYKPAWVKASTAEGPVRAVTFVVNRTGPRYAGRLGEAEAAAHIAAACGQAGPSAEYLLETVRRCGEVGIHDVMLWRLQELVAEKLDELRVPAGE